MHRERVEKRTLTSKTFDLGDGQSRIEVSSGPLHFVRDGKMRDIALVPNRDISGRYFSIAEAPYSLKISTEEPSYIYTSLSGAWVEVTLQTSVRAQPLLEGGLFKWAEVEQDSDYVLEPIATGCRALLFLHSEKSPRQWQWKLAGARTLLRPARGSDASGRILELNEEYDEATATLTVSWTGRVTSRRDLRKNGPSAWSADVHYPVRIDPTVNENVVSGADDVSSFTQGGTSTRFLTGQINIYVVRATSGNTYGGVRFQTIPIPNGATISSATLTVRGIFSSNPNVKVYGSNTDNAAAWSTPGNRVKNISKTSSSTTITSFSNSADNALTVTDIVSEILGRGGWVSNNNIAFGFFQTGTNGGIGFAAFENITLTEARLSITYTAGTPVTAEASASGAASATGVAEAAISVTASASGASDATAVGEAIPAGTVEASASGSAEATAVSQADVTVEASASGTSDATATGAMNYPAAASSLGQSEATAIPLILSFAAGSAAGQSDATAESSFVLVPKKFVIGTGGGVPLYEDPARLRKRVRIKRRREPFTHVIRTGDWPDELVTPPKKKKFVEDDSRYIKSAIDWATSDAEPEDEEEMKIIRELLDEL